LEKNPHNNLRITRILKCLGEFGFEDIKLALIKFFVSEIFGAGNLKGCTESCLKYWIETIKDDTERGMREKWVREREGRRRAVWRKLLYVDLCQDMYKHWYTRTTIGQISLRTLMFHRSLSRVTSNS
jgi:hypothetical protein